MTNLTTTLSTIDPALLRERSARLETIAAELKTELFGIDTVIDRVIDSIRAWYVLPQLISRPVIVCLWGLTGTGKTQLTRSLSRKLGFYDRFVEVQMDGFSNGQIGMGGWRSQDSISAMLGESSIGEGEPGILVLDEYQRFRTKTKNGDDAPVKRYQDVWQLLSDGKLPPSLGFMQQLEYTLADSAYDAQFDETDDEEEGDDAKESKKKKKPKPFKISPWEAREIARALKLKDSLQSIMAWSPEELQLRVRAYKAQTDSWETDYSRLLIIVSGNLDEMYTDLASRVEDCDTNADVFAQLSQQLSVIDVKKALNKRFRPEQVARLGNTHIIYPSLNQASYLRLIDHLSGKYVRQLRESSGYCFELDNSVRQGIYANGVFPAQGTRPLFSSIHSILSAPLVNAALWAAAHSLPAGTALTVSLDVDTQSLNISTALGQTTAFPAVLDIERIKRRASHDFRALVAVHEAGHGLAYAALFGHAPQEVKINVASFEGGYNSYVRLKAESRQNVLDDICVSLAGRAAETLVFGADACSTGSYGDIVQATERAAQFVRHYGFGSRLSHTDVTKDKGDNINTDVQPSNLEIEALLAEQFQRACQLVRDYAAELLLIVAELMKNGSLPPAKMQELLQGKLTVKIITQKVSDEDATPKAELMPVAYADALKVFELQQELLSRLQGKNGEKEQKVADAADFIA